MYSPGGYAFFIREDKLLAQAFDSARLEAKGDALLVAEHVNASTAVSTSAAGTVAYRTGSPDSGQHYLAWVDRTGREIDRVVYPDTSGIGPSLSPDGRHVALFKFVDGNMDIWVYDADRHTWDRATFDSGDDIFPSWSPTGKRIVFGSNRKFGFMNLYSKVLDSAPGSEELLLSTPQPKFAMDWSPDGQILLYSQLSTKGDLDIWALPLGGTRTPFEVVRTDFNEQQPQFSPDGRWIAYQSDKTGRFEIYVQPFPGPGGTVAVSTDGGAQPRWNRDGKELFYVASDDRLMAVPIHTAQNANTLDVGLALALFTTNVSAGDTHRQHYMVSPGGQSFVMNSVPEPTASTAINLILNWKPKR
jgi:dipeptidyl aminopeptidase/acylaminoacyl peptidase